MVGVWRAQAVSIKVAAPHAPPFVCTIMEWWCVVLQTASATVSCWRPYASPHGCRHPQVTGQATYPLLVRTIMAVAAASQSALSDYPAPVSALIYEVRPASQPSETGLHVVGFLPPNASLPVSCPR